MYIVETNYDKFAVNTTNSRVMVDACFAYLKRWVKKHGSLQGAKFVYTPIKTTSIQGIKNARVEPV